MPDAVDRARRRADGEPRRPRWRELLTRSGVITQQPGRSRQPELDAATQR
jgi:hypothetical protein